MQTNSTEFCKVFLVMLMGLEVYIYNLSFSCAQVSLYCSTFLCKPGIVIFNVKVICQKKIFTGVKKSSGILKFM